MADETKNENEEPEAASTSADAEVLENPEAIEPTVAGESSDESVEEIPAAETDAEAEEAVAETPAAEETSAEPAAEASAAEGETEASTSSASAERKRKRKRLPRSERPQRTRPKRVRSAERKPIVRLEKPEHERGRRQERQGTVVSDAMEKTIVVKVEVVKAHPKYKKVVRRSVKFHAHDEQSAAKVGDIVRIVEARPLSKTKRWRLAEVVQAAK